MDTRKLIAGALGTALLVAAVPGATFAQDEAVTPEATDWTLTSLAGEAVPEDVEVTIFLSGGEAIGNAGCNSYFGSYEIDGEALTFPAPLGGTRMLCEDAVMAVEDAYLALLPTTATWAIDEDGALSLANADGVVELIYGEPPIDITSSDVEALAAALADLQTQIDEATAEVTALTDSFESVNVNKLRNRIAANEQAIEDLEKKTKGLNVENLKKRLNAVEKSVASLDKTVANLKKRVNTVEKSVADHEERLVALEEIVPVPEQPLP